MKQFLLVLTMAAALLTWIFLPRRGELSYEWQSQLTPSAGTAGDFYFREMAMGQMEITLKGSVGPDKFLRATEIAKSEIETATGRRVAAVKVAQIIFVLDEAPAEK